jgi:hypothetical protein
MDLSHLVSPALGCLTAVAGVRSVLVRDRVKLSQAYGLTMVSSVAAEYALQFAAHPDPAKLAALLTFVTVGGRTLLIMTHNYSDQTRRRISLGSLAASTTLMFGSQMFCQYGFDPLFRLHSFDPRTLLLLASGAAGCWADYTKSMVTRRRCFMVVGMTSGLFGALTDNLGLTAKNIGADIIINGLAMKFYGEKLPNVPNIRKIVRQLVFRNS